jgi:hypothetical protein
VESEDGLTEDNTSKRFLGVEAKENALGYLSGSGYGQGASRKPYACTEPEPIAFTEATNINDQVFILKRCARPFAETQTWAHRESGKCKCRVRFSMQLGSRSANMPSVDSLCGPNEEGPSDQRLDRREA